MIGLYQMYDEHENYCMFVVAGHQPDDMEEMMEAYKKEEPDFTDSGFISYLHECGYAASRVEPKGVYL